MLPKAHTRRAQHDSHPYLPPVKAKGDRPEPIRRQQQKRSSNHRRPTMKTEHLPRPLAAVRNQSQPERASRSRAVLFRCCFPEPALPMHRAQESLQSLFTADGRRDKVVGVGRGGHSRHKKSRSQAFVLMAVRGRRILSESRKHHDNHDNLTAKTTMTNFRIGVGIPLVTHLWSYQRIVRSLRKLR